MRHEKLNSLISPVETLFTMAEAACNGVNELSTNPIGSISINNSDGTRTILGPQTGNASIATHVGDTTPPPPPIYDVTGGGNVLSIHWDGKLEGAMPADFFAVTFYLKMEGGSQDVLLGQLHAAGTIGYSIDNQAEEKEYTVYGYSEDDACRSDGTPVHNKSARVTKTVKVVNDFKKMENSLEDFKKDADVKYATSKTIDEKTKAITEKIEAEYTKTTDLDKRYAQTSEVQKAADQLYSKVESVFQTKDDTKKTLKEYRTAAEQDIKSNEITTSVSKMIDTKTTESANNIKADITREQDDKFKDLDERIHGQLNNISADVTAAKESAHAIESRVESTETKVSQMADKIVETVTTVINNDGNLKSIKTYFTRTSSGLIIGYDGSDKGIRLNSNGYYEVVRIDWSSDGTPSVRQSPLKVSEDGLRFNDEKGFSSSLLFKNTETTIYDPNDEYDRFKSKEIGGIAITTDAVEMTTKAHFDVKSGVSSSMSILNDDYDISITNIPRIGITTHLGASSASSEARIHMVSGSNNTIELNEGYQSNTFVKLTGESGGTCIMSSGDGSRESSITLTANDPKYTAGGVTHPMKNTPWQYLDCDNWSYPRGANAYIKFVCRMGMVYLYVNWNCSGDHYTGNSIPNEYLPETKLYGVCNIYRSSSVGNIYVPGKWESDRRVWISSMYGNVIGTMCWPIED